jgi:UDP-3-O-[3-hydroxymyristoyl] glucosamine N-acyltransferase
MKLSEIAEKLGCEVRSGGETEIHRMAGIDEAGPGCLTFVSNRKYVSHIKTTRASAIILGYDVPEVPIPSLRSANPYLAFAQALELFAEPLRPEPGIHPMAIIAPDASIGLNPSIGACVVVGTGCTIGSNAVLYPFVMLYPKATLGDDVVLHSHVVVREHCRLGSRVIVQNGVVIGSDGFGFAPKDDGTYYKIRQTGRVVIEDDVEIGANTTIDRAAVGETVIGRGAKLDNLVQVGHGSSVGDHSVVAAQAGLAGSTQLGRGVKVGGQVGFAGHQAIGDAAVVTAQSGVHGDLEPGAVVSGSPAFDTGTWRRAVIAFAKLPEMLRRISCLEKEMERIKADRKKP